MYSISPPMWCFYGASYERYQALVLVEYIGIFKMDGMQIVQHVVKFQLETNNSVEMVNAGGG